LLRIGVGPIAAGLAAFGVGFIAHLWLTLDTETANAGSRADAGGSSISATFHPKLVDFRTANAGLDTKGDRVHLASGQTGAVAELASKESDNRAEQPPARSAFAERFSFDQPGPPNPSLQRSYLSTSFDDRFIGDISLPRAAISSALAAPHAAAPRVAAAPVPVARPAPKRPSRSGLQVASAADTPVSLAYAPSDPEKSSAIPTSPLNGLAPKDSDSPADVDTSRTAIYDITSRTVYLPNGRRLEAHSGLGGHMDDPRYVHVKRTGPTPPNVYELKLREQPFHGVRAIRLIPTDSSKMYGRNGILAHTYMLGPNGESNGCVSFKDYAAFLDAFERGEINRLVVVERLANPPSPKTVTDWLANTLKDIFGQS
jgi:type VI secretion system (T6SS) effector TldE1-like protein